MKKRILGLLSLSIITLVSCSMQYNQPVGYMINNHNEVSKLKKEVDELKILHGKRCAPKELAYAEVYLEALNGITFFDPDYGVYRRVSITNSQRINYLTNARKYIVKAREKIYGDKDGDSLPCYVEIDIGTNPNIPDTKVFNKMESIKERLLSEEKVKNDSFEPLKLTARIHFDLNKITIKKDYLPYLNVIVRYLKSHPELKIKVIGYTDNIGSKKYNDKLAYRRALTIKNYLVNRGINSNRIVISGKGKTEYLVGNNTKLDRFTNRRAEFFIMKATD